MKILKIGGKNLASLAGEFCVDFEAEPLVSAGLFAICGPTGAGKSTLLDALCLALYGTTPRLPKSARGASTLPDVNGEAISTVDPRNLLRRGAADAWAEVDFVGNDALRYRARWSVRRARNKPGGPLQPPGMTLHRLPELAPLGGTRSEAAAEIEQRIGLSFEQFTRAVLLAQNEFSAFLKTDENERGELLETLTGSAVYSDISKRAYDRYKSEQEAMRVLTAQLAKQVPLAAEARAALDAERERAELALAALDARKAVLEQQLRWHEELEKLRRNEAQAEAALNAANVQMELSLPRRRRLATLEAVQPARPLMAELARLQREQADATITLSKGQQELARALELQQQAASNLSAATEALAAAETAQRDAAPLLDQAKALEAAIAALAPAHQQASEARDAAKAEAAQAQASLLAKQQQLEQTRAALQSAAAWLDSHTRHETLAKQWPRWDKLLVQAEKAAEADQAAAAILHDAETAAKAANEKEAQALAGQAQAADGLRALETERQQANAALAAFDIEALRRERRDLDERRTLLAAADKTWTALAGTRSRHDETGQQATEAEAARASAEKALVQAVGDGPALVATAEQAERSLAAAELACADSVEDLRAGLADGEACPVCGSKEHPYQQQDARLHAVLSNLRAEVNRSRRAAQDNASAQAVQRTAVMAAAERLAQLARERTTMATELDKLTADWANQPLAKESPAEAERSTWLSAQQRQLIETAAALDAKEQVAHRAALTRDAAQQAFDKASATHARAQELAVAARADAARLLAGHGALAAKREAAASSLTAVVDELDAAMAEAHGDGWQHAWRDGPSAFRTAREAEARAWTDQSEHHTRHSANVATLDAEHTAAASRAEQATRIATTADEQFARADADIKGKQRQRAALWNGKPAQEVEQALAAAVTQARSALAARQAESAQAAQHETRARDAIAQAGARCTTLQEAVKRVAEQLDQWLAEYRQRHPDLDGLADTAELAALLNAGIETIAQERAALATLETQAASAATVLAERRAQRDLHLQSAAQDNPATAEEAQASLGALNADRSAQHEAATALRLQAAQDDARRAQGQALLAEIEKQQAAEQRWGRLSELIGSADGKKFRNYAQQFTLDVLLGYANRHLAQLARRYRLERVVHATGPSLALMVRDHDMGGEVRPVNSLSGGESFLVSLALALGLASLSSNRVRVESLFIDEGFGSLDADTLGVAMDALDALQAQGRKVGVISHVQEMTERIAARINVRPAGGGASAVSVQ